MSRRQPFDFSEREPGVQNSAPVPLRDIIPGSTIWEDLFGRAAGLPIPTEQTALTVSAIYASVSLIAGVIAALPIRIYDRALDGELTELPSDDLWWLLNEQMLPRWSAASGWEFVGQAKLLRGDGYQKIHRTQNGAILGFEPLHYDRVSPIPTPDGKRLIYIVAPDPTVPLNPAGVEVLDQDDVLHYAGFGFNGVRGLSPLRYFLRMAAPVALASQEYAARFFANGARPDYVLQTDQNLGPEAIDKLRAQVEERNGGSLNAHKPMVLTNGLKAEPLSLPAEEAQLLATRQFQIEEVARIYGIPPFMIGSTEKTTSWGSGVESMGEGFVRYALRRHLNKFENELNRKVFRTSRRVLRFDTSELVKANFAALINAYRVALGRAGEDSMLTVEEVREGLNLRRTPVHGTLGKGTGNAPDPAAQPSKS